MSVNSKISSTQSGSVSLPSQGVSASARDRANRHFQRAKEQIKMKNLNSAVQELRDAIQTDPNNSEYHALLAQVQLNKGLTGMANISLRQALKLNPNDPIAQECLKAMNARASKKPDKPATGFLGGLFGAKK